MQASTPPKLSQTQETPRSARIQLDDLLSVEQAAEWLQLSVREVRAKSKGRSPKIAGYWINSRVVRFHPRAVLARFAKDNGAPPEFIAAMFADLTRNAQ